MRMILKIIFITFGLISGQTAEQIKQAKEVIKRTGMSESQARDAAKLQGYTDNQIDAIIQKERLLNVVPEDNNNKLPSKVGQDQSTVGSSESKIVELDDNNQVSFDYLEDEVLKADSQIQPKVKGLNYFGYDIFSRDPALFQATSVGAVDPDYLIGPGDEIIIMLWGETQFRQELIVDREGFVFIPEIGQVFVNGLNLSLLESKLFRVFSQAYASLNPQGRAPTTFLDVSLGNLRPLRIQVLGEVAQPGAYTVSPSATLFSALYYFNGPTTLGSLRDIQLIRGEKKIASIDFYDYLLTGKKPNDYKLQLDDVIFIPRRLKTVSIDGEVNRSGIYELKPEESFEDLISIAGNLKITAYMERSQIDRIVPFQDRIRLGMDRMYKDVNLNDITKSGSSFLLQDGDRVQIFSVLDARQNIVELKGAVTRPGRYDLGDSLRLSELIDKADGLLGDAYMKRVDIVRTLSDFKQELIKLNLELALEGDQNNDIYLKGLDEVQVYGITDMVPSKYVYINGHVRNPGKFILQENMTIYDLIFKAGGFIDEEFKKQAFLGRADLLRVEDDKLDRTIISFDLGELLDYPDSGSDLPLQANDIIRIYKKEIFDSKKTIIINGVVREPGVYQLKRDMTLKDLILEAGGLEQNIYRYKVEVARIDPMNKNLDEFAEVVAFHIDEKFSVSNANSKPLIEEKLGRSIDSFKLNPFDLITIRSDPYFRNHKKITISGAVLYPGEYTILSSNEKITDIIERAGGLMPNAYSFGSVFTRKGKRVRMNLEKILKNPRSKLNIELQDGDLIDIALEPKMIQVQGEVNSQGFYKFQPKKRIKDIIEISGGLTKDAEKKSIYIRYPNGTSHKYNRWLNNKKVLDGSVITVGKKQEEEPFDKTEYAKELTSILANLAQVFSIIILAKS